MSFYPSVMSYSLEMKIVITLFSVTVKPTEMKLGTVAGCSMCVQNHDITYLLLYFSIILSL